MEREARENLIQHLEEAAEQLRWAITCVRHSAFDWALHGLANANAITLTAADDLTEPAAKRKRRDEEEKVA